MFAPFGWLRRKVAEAVVQGVADGLKAVIPEDEEPPADVDSLRKLLAEASGAKALPPAKDEDEPAKGKRK